MPGRGCLLFHFISFYLPLCKQQKAARAGWSLRSAADSRSPPCAEGWGWFFLEGGVGARVIFDILCGALSVPLTAGMREGGTPPGGGAGSSRLCPLLLSGLPWVLRSGRAPPREGPRAERGVRASPLPRVRSAPRALCVYLASLAGGGLFCC